MTVHRVTRRLAIATASVCPEVEADDAHLLASLQQLGIETVVCVWNDPQVDWSRFDAVLLRRTWDYYQHHAAFLHWLDRLDRLGVATINNSSLVRWNSDKRYLPELARLGVAIIPTRLADAHALRAMLAGMQGQHVVVKPTISAGAWHNVSGIVGTADFGQALAQLPAELAYLVQPFVPEIVNDGEWSLLFFDGEFSHAVIKRAATGDYRVQTEFGGSVEAAQPDAATLVAARSALAAAAALGHADHAYVRVDGVISAGRFLLMELEMIEPSLFFGDNLRAAETFARQLAGRLERLHAGAEDAASRICASVPR